MLHEFVGSLDAWLTRQYDPMKFGYRNHEDRDDGYGFDLRELNLNGLRSELTN